jgi:hypothetical protein
MKKEDRRLVVVVWDDAWQDQENFVTAHGIASTHEPLKVTTLGWVIRDDEVGISVANERSVDDGKDVFRGRTFIPRAMVKSVTDFILATPRKKKSAAEAAPLSSSPSLSGQP